MSLRADEEPVTDHPATHWRSRHLVPVLPDGLPVGALTTIVMPTLGGLRHGPWFTLVYQTCLDTYDQCRPLAYTYADTAYVFGPIDAGYAFGPRYLNVIDAIDDGVPDQRDVPSKYWGSTPMRPWRGIFERVDSAAGTLESLRAGLVDHEAEHGPSLAVLDNAEGARLGRDHVGRRADRLERGDAASTAAAFAAALADELAQFALNRPEAPTVAVWSTNRLDDPGPRALAARSQAVIVGAHRPGRGAVPVTAHARTSLVEPWSAGLTADLPRYSDHIRNRGIVDFGEPFERDEARRPTDETDWIFRIGSAAGSPALQSRPRGWT